MEARLRAQNSQPAGGSSPSVVFHISPQAHRCQEVRDRVAAFAGEYGLAGEDLAEFMTAVGEAVANAIEHAGVELPIEVECRAARDRVLATVRDAGIGFALASPAESRLDLPGAEAERGRGIIIMRRCSDIFVIESRPGGGTSVTIGRMLRTQGGAGRTTRPAAV